MLNTRGPEVVHGQKAGDEYLRVSVHHHHHHHWRGAIRRVLRLLAGSRRLF